MIEKYKDIMMYMELAHVIAKRSYAKRKKVGCVLVACDYRNIISYSWNGTLSGDDNNCEDKNGNTLNTVIHAELNAIIKAALYGHSTTEAILFCTLSPCIGCASSIIQAGISTIFFDEYYRDTSGVSFLNKKGVRCININELVSA